MGSRSTLAGTAVLALAVLAPREAASQQLLPGERQASVTAYRIQMLSEGFTGRPK